MKFNVIWKSNAEDELAAIWMASDDRNIVTRASRMLDVCLATTPLEVGEARESSIHRVFFSPPLWVEYEVIVDDLKVIVFKVHAL